MFEKLESIKPFGCYDCLLNDISFDELFQFYRSNGFIYPEKMSLLSPYIPIIKNNWIQAMKLSDKILWNTTYKSYGFMQSTVCSWMTTSKSLNSQHLVSQNPICSALVMLATQARIFHKGDEFLSIQNWFRPQNKYAMKVFGTLEKTLGSQNAVVFNNAYCKYTPESSDSFSDLLPVHVISNREQAIAVDFLLKNKGMVYVTAEEYDQDDLNLSSLNSQYAKVGLFRYRRILVVEHPTKDTIMGMACIYRGPLGINFSFLENRCELIIDPDIESHQKKKVINSLLHGAIKEYEGFELDYIPVIVSVSDIDSCMQTGLQYLRDYNQSIWLRDGFRDYYHHLYNIFSPIIKRKGNYLVSQ